MPEAKRCTSRKKAGMSDREVKITVAVEVRKIGIDWFTAFGGEAEV